MSRPDYIPPPGAKGLVKQWADDTRDAPKAPARTLPALDPDNTAFWTGGARGELLINRCCDCHYFVHPPCSFCPQCEGRNVVPTAVSGRATVVTVTVNHRAWFSGLPVPYAVAIVEIDEQPGVHLVTNIVDCDPEAVRIGDRVAVRFEQAEDLWIPLFSPITDAS